MAVPLVAQEACEHGGGVEPRQAQPVDRPVDADQRRGLQVTDEPVVLDPHDAAAGAACGAGSRRRAAAASMASRPTAAQPSSTARWPAAAAPSKNAVLRTRFPPAPGGRS